MRVRTDLAATLFLNELDDCDGDELVITGSMGERRIKLPADDMVLYPGTSVHKVTLVARSVRMASFFWMQSAVRDNQQRALLYELENVVRELGALPEAHRHSVRLAELCHNLIRLWADS